MAAQSRTRTFLLTRPKAQSLDFARTLQQHFAVPISIFISPLLRVEFVTPTIPEMDFEAVIFTSQTAVEAARRISASGVMLPGRAFCVGEQTARIATKAGFEALSADSNAAGLVEMVKAQRPTGPLIHLRGQYSHGAVAESLISAGIETYEAVIYRQTAQPLNSEALAVLGKTEPVFVPLFSPRSAKLFADELLALMPRAPLYIAALSAAVAQEVLTLPVASLEIAPTSDSSGMVKALGALFATAPGP